MKAQVGSISCLEPRLGEYCNTKHGLTSITGVGPATSMTYAREEKRLWKNKGISKFQLWLFGLQLML